MLRKRPGVIKFQEAFALLMVLVLFAGFCSAMRRGLPAFMVAPGFTLFWACRVKMSVEGREKGAFSHPLG